MPVPFKCFDKKIFIFDRYVDDKEGFGYQTLRL